MRGQSQPLPVCASREWLRELSVDWPESQRQQLASLLQRGYVPVRFRGLATDEMAVSASAYQEAETPAGRSKKPGSGKRAGRTNSSSTR